MCRRTFPPLARWRSSLRTGTTGLGSRRRRTPPRELLRGHRTRLRRGVRRPQPRTRASLVAKHSGAAALPKPTYCPFIKSVIQADGDPNLLPWVAMAKALDWAGRARRLPAARRPERPGHHDQRHRVPRPRPPQHRSAEPHGHREGPNWLHWFQEGGSTWSRPRHRRGGRRPARVRGDIGHVEQYRGTGSTWEY